MAYHSVSDFKAFQNILQTLPKNIQLQIINSSAIRYAQLFDVEKLCEVFCIVEQTESAEDTSTAIGAAFASQNQQFYNWNISFFTTVMPYKVLFRKNFKIILINNGDWRNFKFFTGHERNAGLISFETSHCLTAEHLAKNVWL
jgi:2-succinyl-5-enolpyruvyl-6-hydroxy-3-cyclohexene-1-carboxylate synthase